MVVWLICIVAFALAFFLLFLIALCKAASERDEMLERIRSKEKAKAKEEITQTNTSCLDYSSDL